MTHTMEKTDVKLAAPSLHLPNANSTAEDVLNKALEFCAKKMGLQDGQSVIQQLGQSKRRACEYCHYSIAGQVGAALGALDENIKAAYMFEVEATPEDACFNETTGIPLVHVLVWTERKTKALDSLVAMLDRALAQTYGRLIGPANLQHLLDVQIVDDAEVERRVGYGALLHSLYQRPIKVWEP